MGNLPGHFSQITGDSAEEDLYALARAIGFGLVRSRNPVPGIDFVADFNGRPTANSTLLRPFFSPTGLTAFSVKSGDFTPGDVQQLIDYVAQCQQSTDPTLQQVAGGVLVAGTNRTQGQLNDLLSRGVYCWDIKRLIFYSVKAKTVDLLSETGSVTEYPLGVGVKGGFVLAPLSMSGSIVEVDTHIFVDDHDLVIQGDHVRSFLGQIAQSGLTPIVNSMHRDVNARVSLHAMGPIERQVADDAFRSFSAATAESNSRIHFPAGREFEMQSYATGPWTAIFRMDELARVLTVSQSRSAQE